VRGEDEREGERKRECDDNMKCKNGTGKCLGCGATLKNGNALCFDCRGEPTMTQKERNVIRMASALNGNMGDITLVDEFLDTAARGIVPLMGFTEKPEQETALGR
jgi:hypothetical protein